MADVSVDFAVGSEQVTVVLPVDLPTDGETIITGDFGGLVAAGTVARLRGNVNLTGNMHVRGTLTCDPSGVDLNGNGFDIHTHDGTLNLVGTEKTAWLTWGETPVGWVVGDRLVVAPTKAGIYVPTEMMWTGSWATMTRPVNSPDVTLVNGSIARPEVANLSQSVTLRNLERIMIHEASASNPQTFKWIRVLNSGVTGILGMYPIHFHMTGDHARGSVLEGVVVEGGKNHAYVPHASHGITYKGCVAYNTAGPAYWWDPPLDNNAPDPNETHDVVYDHCLAMLVTGTDARLDGFTLGRGNGNKCIGSVGVAVQGGSQSSGFEWPEAGTGVWEFSDCVAHNNKSFGIFAWQNTVFDHIVGPFVGYRNGRAGIMHGAYLNFYQYRDIVLSENVQWAFMQHALSNNQTAHPNRHIVFEDMITDGALHVSSHNVASGRAVYYRRCTFTGVTFNEVNAGRYSYEIFEDCGLVPADFTLTLIQPQTVIAIFESGALQHRWASGVWS